MKRIQSILHNTHDIVLVAICLFVLLVVMIIAITNLWCYALCVAILLYLYKSRGIRFMQKKHTRTEKKS